MKCFSGFIACGLALLLGDVANSADDTFAQIGTWGCTIPPKSSVTRCPPIVFPNEFGGPRITIVGGCEDHCSVGGSYLEIANVTTTGFQIVTRIPGFRMGQGGPAPPRPISGNWIAVGLVKP
jgi:hypothetical protein